MWQYNEKLRKQSKVKVQTSTSLKCSGGTSRELCMNESLQTSMKQSNILWMSGLKFLHNNVRDWKSRTDNVIELLLLTVVLQTVKS